MYMYSKEAVKKNLTCTVYKIYTKNIHVHPLKTCSLKCSDLYFIINNER